MRKPCQIGLVAVLLTLSSMTLKEEFDVGAEDGVPALPIASLSTRPAMGSSRQAP